MFVDDRRGDESHVEDENVKGHAILSCLCFSTPVVKHLWAYISESTKDSSKEIQPCVVELFCRLVSHELLVVDDVEWMESGVPLPILTFDTLITMLKPLVLKHVTREIVDHNSVLYAATGLLRHTYDRLAHIKLRGSIPVIFHLNGLLHLHLVRNGVLRYVLFIHFTSTVNELTLNRSRQVLLGFTRTHSF